MANATGKQMAEAPREEDPHLQAPELFDGRFA